MISNERKQKLLDQLSRYLPDGFEQMVADLILEYPCKFVVAKPRATKLGDYRAPFPPVKYHQITVNGNLNKYSFLVTTLHEFAHLHCFVQNGRSVKPHGEEWKACYRKLILQALELQLIPKDIEIALVNSLANMKASSCTDLQLSKALRNYDQKKENETLLSDIPKNSTFALSGRIFRKGELRRTRYVCEEVNTKRQFLVHTHAEIKLITNE